MAGSGIAQTELTDGDVAQTLDVGQIARRGNTLAGTEGIFRCVLETNHVGADTQSTAILPYTPGAAIAIAPYPSPVPDTFDVWLLGACVVRTSGGGTMAAGIRITNMQQGWGQDELGAQVISTEQPVIAFWNGINATTTEAMALTQTREPWKRLMFRIPRKGETNTGPFIQFFSQASLAAVFQCVMLLGVFPVALGQDAVE